MSTADGFTTARIISADGRLAAEFAPGANMLCHSLTLDGRQRLHTGAGVRVYAEQGKTMGIPLLYPWANRLSGRVYRAAGREVTLPEPEGRYRLDPNGLPRHGALPELLRWEVDAGGGSGDRLLGRLAWSSEDLLGLFPYPHELELVASVADGRLTVSTTVRATGDIAVPVSYGFHPYLHLPDVPRERWQVDLGASRRLVLDELVLPTGRSEPLAQSSFTLGDSSWDDGLADLSQPPRFGVGAGGASVEVVFEEGFGNAQVYAPPGQDFICFEPMTAPTNALVSGDGLRLVAPGQSDRTTFSVRVADN